MAGRGAPRPKPAVEAPLVSEAVAAIRALPYGGMDDATRRIDLPPTVRAAVSPAILALRWGAVGLRPGVRGAGGVPRFVRGRGRHRGLPLPHHLAHDHPDPPGLRRARATGSRHWSTWPCSDWPSATTAGSRARSSSACWPPWWWWRSVGGAPGASSASSSPVPRSWPGPRSVPTGLAAQWDDQRDLAVVDHVGARHRGGRIRPQPPGGRRATAAQPWSARSNRLSETNDLLTMLNSVARTLPTSLTLREALERSRQQLRPRSTPARDLPGQLRRERPGLGPEAGRGLRPAAGLPRRRAARAVAVVLWTARHRSCAAT